MASPSAHRSKRGYKKTIVLLSNRGKASDGQMHSKKQALKPMNN